MNLSKFLTTNFYEALESFFNDLKVPVSKIASEPADAKDIISNNYKSENEAHKLINKVYFLGMVNEQAFDGTKNTESLETVKALKEDYDGILIFGIELNSRRDGLLPTRSQLAEISRAFNREYNYTPVTIVFKYGKMLAFANSERLKYKQEWREGEKVGKVSLLRDINVEVPHSGHLRILQELEIPRTGKNAVDSYEKLYKYWQEVFSVSLLNKKFYKELSNWYFWAIKHVMFPNRPTAAIAHEKGIELDELIREHNATNVIRLLTRILFVWFIKEKRLIPDELFDLNTLQTDILKEISPYHETDGFFASANKESVYYKAILQNLFFASLNCPIKADDIDARTRGFRLNNHYGQDRGNDWRYRYENYFKNPDAFLELINNTVPFLNGGLFECLDEKLKNIYIDGFSDQMTKGELLVVPDYLFFGTDSIDDISEITGIKDSQNKQAEVKGLINILKSYKFTITENTPIEEDIELDPELLGKVFENLLASYNPETKTTARKQTGSFYTPREIVNYMVDESLIAYLKNQLSDKAKETDLDLALHNLISYSDINPFADDTDATGKIIVALDKCKILDPACGSGAFPMGVLQKMVHILQKLDPNNELWHELQLQKAMDETRTAYQIQDKKEREKQILEINEAFDESINDPDYARKLYLIENCIYGVDIQPIAIQISKLRFFISLVSDQKPKSILDNFGIKPLPNLETRFVAANTLIGIEKPKEMASLFENQELKQLENELKQIRHKLFSARTKDTKLKYRQKDAELREQISKLLKENHWPVDTAEKLAKWDPYNQNEHSPFFDPEWMFDIKEGFDVVIGNPPYLLISQEEFLLKYKYYFQFQEGKPDLYRLFIEWAIKSVRQNGVVGYITPNTFLTIPSAHKIRKQIIENTTILKIINYDESVFESASVNSVVFHIKNCKCLTNHTFHAVALLNNLSTSKLKIITQKVSKENLKFEINIFNDSLADEILNKITSNCIRLDKLENVNFTLGLQPYHNTLHTSEQIASRFLHSDNKKNKFYYKELSGKNISKYLTNSNVQKFLDFSAEMYTKPSFDFFSGERLVLREIVSDTLIVGITDEVLLFNKSCYIIKSCNKNYSNKYLLALLNSQVIGFFVRNMGDKSKQTLFPRITMRTLKMIPIKIHNYTIYLKITNLVDAIINLENKDNLNLIKRIDEIIFKLYDLTYEEVLVVCPEFWLSREEYEGIEI